MDALGGKESFTAHQNAFLVVDRDAMHDLHMKGRKGGSAAIDSTHQTGPASRQGPKNVGSLLDATLCTLCNAALVPTISQVVSWSQQAQTCSQLANRKPRLPVR